MKRWIPLLLIACQPVLVLADDNPRCKAKADSVQQEIQAAQAAGNTQRVKGLQSALRQLKANCSDAGLLREDNAKLAEARRKVEQRQAELDEERSSGGSATKLAKRQAKLDEAKASLKQAQDSVGR
ncbi:DUF1090 domain-containing protein [Pseudomonas sp. LRF_L74]|uniref:DUF1090 domain-containing protein n=1 Tax=Pseudomonas sp. LRF_L74 TaxID=3369422 RepID=UPI003F5EEBA2